MTERRSVLVNPEDMERLLQAFQQQGQTLASQNEALQAIADEIQRQPRQFSSPFEPLFREGDTVHLIKADGSVDVMVDAVDAMPNLRHDFGQLTGDSLEQAVTDTTGNDLLDMGNGQLAQLRFSPVTAFTARLFNPAGSRRWNTSHSNFEIPPWVSDDRLLQTLRDFYFAASQFWVYQNDTPRFDLIQVGNRQVEAYVDFWGWKYHWQRINERGAKNLRVNGWPR